MDKEYMKIILKLTSRHSPHCFHCKIPHSGELYSAEHHSCMDPEIVSVGGVHIQTRVGPA